MRSFKNALWMLFFLFVNFSMLEGSPSTIFWTVCTTDVYKTGTGNINVDNFFTVWNRRGHGSFFPSDIGFDLGIFSWKDLSAEGGVDYLGGTDDPLFFNFAIRVQEDKLFSHGPSLKVGLFNFGTRYHGHGRTNQNIVDVVIGKSLPNWLGGKIFIGGFSGGRAMGKNRQGFMVGYQRSFCPAKYCGDINYFKWQFGADYASGKNTIGGGGVGVTYFFTPDINVLTGPVWFNSAELNGKWKWSIQINMSFPIFEYRKT